jgi:hypothetical protein
MHIFVNTNSGKTITLNAKSNDLINTIKEKLFIINEIPLDNQRLVFEGFELSDSQTLKYYKIKKNSTLHLGIKIYGGLPVSVTGGTIIDAASAAATAASGIAQTVATSTSGFGKIAQSAAALITKIGIARIQFMAKFAQARGKFMWGVMAFANFMRTVFQFFVVIVLARIIVGFFSKPLEFIMLGIACVFLSVIYVIYYIFYIPPFIWIPFLIWFSLFDLLPWIVYCTVMLVLFVIITFFILILAFINFVTAGSLKSLVLCQNHVAAWYKTPNYQLKNKYERGFLCSRQCLTGYSPDQTSMYCIKIPKETPSYCPEAEIMRMFTTNKNDVNYYYRDYNIVGNMKYMTSSPLQRENLLKAHYLKKMTFLDTCKKSMNKYSIPLNICSALDAIESNKINSIDKKTIERMKNVCQQAYCNSQSNYPFCSGLAGGNDEDNGLFYKKVCKILISIVIIMFIIVFILNYMAKNVMD